MLEVAYEESFLEAIRLAYQMVEVEDRQLSLLLVYFSKGERRAYVRGTQMVEGMIGHQDFDQALDLNLIDLLQRTMM